MPSPALVRRLLTSMFRTPAAPTIRTRVRPIGGALEHLEDRTTPTTVTFDFTGGVQTWAVPAGLTSATFEVYGAQGAAGGGLATATLSLTPGEVLAVYVGGAASGTTGGFNGGGNAGSSINPGTGGGGGSDVRRDANSNTVYELTERILVAGGGGGAGGFVGGAGGAGGGLSGGGGGTRLGIGGGGGTQSAGGAGGGGGGAGGFGVGGTGESASRSIDDSGGGGGGGYFGGGGGGADLRGGGGGGGSGFGPTGTVFSSGVRSGNGRVVITYNFAPVLSGANNFTAVDEDDVTNTGTAVSVLVSGQISDPDTGDPQGIAITATNSANGTWQFSTDAGANWTNVGTVSGSSALLLTTSAGTRVRFVPNANFNGVVSNALTFRAWDQFAGTEGTKVDTSTNGGITAFSTATASNSITVTAVNDVPVADASSVSTNQDTPKAFAVPDFAFSDVESNPLASITIQSLNLAAGDTLQLSGTNVSVNDTITAADIPNLVYTPASGANGAARSSFTFTVNDAGAGTVSATMTINVIDNVAPTATVTSTAPAVTNTSPIPVTVTFSEPVTGFTAGSVVVSNGTVTNFAGSGTTYTFAVVPTGPGVVTVDVPKGAGQDGAGNDSAAASRLTRTFDPVRPGVVIGRPSVPRVTAGRGAVVSYLVTYSDLNLVSAALTARDVVLVRAGTANGVVTVTRVNATTFRVTVSRVTGSGSLGIAIRAGTAADAAGNLAGAVAPGPQFAVEPAPFRGLRITRLGR
ncbi:Putative uncharacterized protein OS=[Oscillatoria] sp. PCC 6506 GN=OSCI_1680008 PE=4 SV=1: Gly_rich [Gemmataceae bacterium]|nr:Putative uncharacterized protein OS=[Oscillatoria] sp. PCC 6506 GN=OSCI_1680008 PE=4 SV=1: Gly_rich [Gemmataceae bacterium]VTU00051.1 Putative uncharacterized protein OS=[Oscillatoria] sp. PCC 6506 GN=OSCI_1680008 PE=4 SV=1: Gly_rich [Gemmataceae bacterium]